MIDRTAFSKTKYGWEWEKTGKFFLGQEVSVSINTITDSEDPHRDLFDEQIETLNLILSKWEELAKTVEAGILADGYTSKEELTRVADQPHIWLGMDSDTQLPWKNRGWIFVVGVTESEDFAWDTIFEGLDCIETAAGD